MLMFLPGGDRAGGSAKRWSRREARGLLLRGEADYQLHLIYLWYERQHSTALRLIEGLRTRYPHNPVFYLRLADVQGNYIRNHQAALQTYRSMLDAARAGTHRIACDVGGVRAARHGAGDGCALRQRRSDRAVERGDRAEAGGAVRRARARVLSTRRRSRSSGTAIGCDRRVSARAAPRSLATIDCALREKIRAGDRACAGQHAHVPALVQKFFDFQSLFC